MLNFWRYKIVNRWYRFICYMGQWIPIPQWVATYIERNYYGEGSN